MEALKYKTIVKQDGEIKLSGVPFKKGQEVEMIILIESSTSNQKQVERGKKFSAVRLKTSGFKFDRETANER